MKPRSALLVLTLIIVTSCRHKSTVVEATYPDGSPKRVCVYLGSGDRKELLNETYYYRNKNIQVTGEFRHSQRNGRWIYYYETGKVWSEGYFRNGKNDGRRITYFPNGRVRYEAFYRNNQRVGIWKFYDETGKLVRTVNFSSGGK